MPEAAERALVSNATAYRYFASADELWLEASMAAADFEPMMDQADTMMEHAGADPQARLEAAIRSISWRMLDDQVPFRLVAKSALERWFAQAEADPVARVPVRGGRRNRASREVLEPLGGRLHERDLERVAAALGLILGTDSMIALTDGVGLSADEAKSVLVDAGRWLLAGALAELEHAPRG
jgi:AcrR family transcriptional regulator